MAASNKYDYQCDGVAGTLTEANRQIASQRNATPASIRDQYKSGIRYIKADRKYFWYWVLK
jgi:hypothetical protein